MPFISTSAGRVYYAERGSGTPIVMLAATLHDHVDFDPVADRLSARYRTIAVDWPGHGRSEPVAGGAPATGPLFATVLAELVDGLDLERAVLIGNSVGGYAAARLALDQPERVAGLVLVNTAGFVRQTAMLRLGCRALGTPWLNRLLYPHLVTGYMRARNGHGRAVATRVRDLARTAEGSRLAAEVWRGFPDPAYDLRAEGPRLTMPTLLVWGSRDIVLPLRTGHDTRAAIPGARFETFDTGHVVFASDPAGFVDLVEPFIEQVTAGTGA
ncbi:alpha/beta fold hydrolase [Pseudonocardia acaciae]|uniref:alpha/beta fold hydrolase n=1 Tax=Pseudonocardia acaciae TaxID=551276 RepID=UPI0004914363|nr:alpha/beta fold hydrolase [Pseudonocardia acaciae]